MIGTFTMIILNIFFLYMYIMGEIDIGTVLILSTLSLIVAILGDKYEKEVN